MADSISPWLDRAALAHDSTYGSMIANNSHESYEEGSHAQILAFTSDPYDPHGLWIELSDRELIVSAFVPQSEIDAFNRVNSESFLSQRHAVITIQRFNWIVEQPVDRTSVAAKHGQEQGYEPKTRRVCIKVIAMKSLAPGLGNVVRGKRGENLRVLARSSTPRTCAWVEECLDKYFCDKTFAENQYRTRKGMLILRDGQMRREEESAVGKARVTLETLDNDANEDQPVEVAVPPPGPRARVRVPGLPPAARPASSKDALSRSRTYWFDDTLQHKSKIIESMRIASLRENVVTAPSASTRLSKSTTTSPEQRKSENLHTRNPTASPQRAPRARATVPSLPTAPVRHSPAEPAMRARARPLVPPLLPLPPRQPAASPLASAAHPTPAPTSTPPPAQKYAHDISLSDIPKGTGTTIASPHMPVQSQYSNHPPARQPRKRSRDTDSSPPRNEDQFASASPEALDNITGELDEDIVDDSEELDEGTATDDDEFDNAQRPQSSYTLPLVAIEEFMESESDEDEEVASVHRQLKAAHSSVAPPEMVVDESFKLGWEPPEDESQQTQLPSPASIRAASIPKIVGDLPEPMDVDYPVTQASHNKSFSRPAPCASSPLSRHSRHSQQSLQRAASPPDELEKPIVPLPHREHDARSPFPAPAHSPSPVPQVLAPEERASLLRKERRAARKAQNRPRKAEWLVNRIRLGLLVKD